MYYESLWNHVVIQQGVFIRLKITSYIASLMNNSKNSWSIWFSWFAIFSKKECKSSFSNCQNALQIANCERQIRTLDCLPKLKWGLWQAFQDLQHSGNTCKIREKVGKFSKSGKTLQTQEKFLENHSAQGKLREKF